MENEEGRLEGRIACRHENVVLGRRRSLVGVEDPQLGTIDSNVIFIFFFMCEA